MGSDLAERSAGGRGRLFAERTLRIHSSLDFGFASIVRRPSSVVRRPSLLVIALLLGAVLRLAGLGRQGFWTDELYVVWEGRQPLDVLFNPILHYQHPPGYRLALHLWMGLWDGGTSETWIRLLPSLSGIALIPIVWALGRALWGGQGSAAGIAALIAATSPFLLHYSQDATTYSWTILWLAASALTLLHAWRTDSVRLWIAWGVTMAVALYSHYFSIFPLIVEVAGVAYAVLWTRRLRIADCGLRIDDTKANPQPTIHNPQSARGLHATLALLGAIALYLPWIIVLIAHSGEMPTPLFPLYWDGYPVVWIPQLLVGFRHERLWQSDWALLAVWAVLGGGVAYLAWRLLRVRIADCGLRNVTRHAVLVVSWGLLAIGGPYVALRVTYPPPGVYDWARFASFAAPALLLGIAGLMALLHPALRAVALGTWLLMAGIQWQAEITAPPAQDWRGALATVAAGAKEGDTFLAFTAFHAGAAAAYYPVPLPVEGGWFTQEGDDPTGAAYWFPPDWRWRGFLNSSAYRSADLQGEISKRTTAPGRLWYLAGDTSGSEIDGNYPSSPAFERALSSLGWHMVQEWHTSPMVLRLYTRIKDKG